MNVPSKAEGIALCSAFILASVFIVVGNLLTIVLFSVNKTLRKKSLFLVINMTFADLMLGALSLPIYIYDVGAYFQLWTGGFTGKSHLDVFFLIVDTMFSQASLISATMISCERFYVVFWPLKSRTLSMRAYHIAIFITWTLALLISAFWTVFSLQESHKNVVYAWMPYTFALTFIICGSNIGIWRTFLHGSVPSQKQSRASQKLRASQNKRLTKTLLFVSIIALLSWLPLIIMNYLIFVFRVPIPLRFYFMVNVLNYSNSFVNPIAYALRIPEFRQALGLCCLWRQAAMDTELTERRNNRAATMKQMAQPTTSQTDASYL